MDLPIEGMEKVVATVSGYHGTERFNLIKLISHSGASYVGAMSRSITHLLCWKFEGRKYELAMKFKETIIVNHRWIEDCIKQGKRVSEHPYMLQSGSEVGPLLLEVPIIDKNRNCKALLDKFSIFEDSERRDYGKDCRDSSGDEGTSTYSNKRLMRGKRKIFYDIGNTSLTKPSCDGRRLMKKNLGRDNLEIGILDSDNECHPIIPLDENSDAATSSEFEDHKRTVNTFEIGTASDSALNTEASRYEAFDNIEEISGRNYMPAPENTSSYPEVTAVDTPYGCPAIQNLAGKNDDVSQSECISGLPTSVELSCVICWTDFSSIRGVLPCGHRFCYSCIQNWADHMISRGKISTCPLCKTSFVSITKVEDAATSDQKIYSQTIPCDSSTTNILMLHDRANRFGVESSLATVCGECCCREPEDLLISCDHCHIRCIHIYCLDPPLIPWTCIQCKDLQRLYYHAR
ncbi:ubiquitin-protein ligase, putative [Ricinus communis]|uniref:Ubiquitin-protein ligase, putative n=1 Tax=Ricinus communis TaxID=3988 RepID=B9SZR2_RICCO|nr:ubiquitin-protein ligase, putative [Ricinus communis]